MTLSLSSCFRSCLFFSFSVLLVLSSPEEFQRSFKKVERVFEVSRVFQKVLRVFAGNFNGVSKKFQKCFKEVSRVFQGSFSRMFQERFKGVSSKIKGHSKR